MTTSTIKEPIMVGCLTLGKRVVHFYTMGVNLQMTKEYTLGSRSIKTTKYKTIETMRKRWAGLVKFGYKQKPVSEALASIGK